MNIIEKARENLRGHWYKGEYVDADSGQNFCALGHISLQLGATVEKSLFDGEDFYSLDTDSFEDLEDWNRANNLLVKVAKEQFPERYENLSGNLSFRADSIPYFNDHEDTTEEDMLIVFGKAAVLWDEEVN